MAVEPPLEAMTQLLGWRPSSITAVRGGYTPAARYVVGDGHRRAFLKIATTAHTALLLRREIAAYRALPEGLRPRLLAYDAEGVHPALAIEDLSEAVWPPPWTDDRVAAALSAIGQLHALHPDLPSFEAVHGVDLGWRAVRADPEPFLSLKLMTPEGLAAALPALLEAEAACPTSGTAATHFDLRSDNMCFVSGKATLIDWAEACLSNPRLDLGFWLPSLSFEGGPPPEAVLPDAPDVAAWVSGYFAARAGLAEIPDAPFVRRVQRQQLSEALPWARRALGF